MFEKALSKGGMAFKGMTLPEQNKMRYSKTDVSAPTRFGIIPKAGSKKPKV